MKKEKFYKEINGEKVFCLEYDKETLKDLALDLQDELEMYKALYFREKRKLDKILRNLQEYEYLLPDDYRSIIKEFLKIEGIKYHE